jgi:ribosomal protein S18 acetylase RimI-like enzyme
MDIDIESLESATLDAVAPLEVGRLHGWLLPFDTTTVGRAISAVPTAHEAIDLDLITAIESCYAHRGLKVQFRIADVPGLTTLQERLRQEGYVPQQPTLTLVGRIHGWQTPSNGLPVQLSVVPSDTWMSVYLSADFDPIDGANRVKALSRSMHLVYASLSNETGAIAAGTASFSHGWASLHGLRTLALHRGKGHATRLISTLVREAQSKGFTRCFLQVEEGNAPAIHLYRGLGFQAAWRYHYWRKPVQAAA